MKAKILDTTLRDGEQTPGVMFTLQEKMEIARRLSDAGVHIIEAGIPAMGAEEKEAVRRIQAMNLKADILTWNRAVESDILESLEIGIKHIHISLPVSDQMIYEKIKKSKEWVLNRLKYISGFVLEKGAILSVGAEDSSRADDQFLMEYALTAQNAGAVRVRLCDTVGVMDPFQVYEKFKPVCDAVDIEKEIHTHNDLGMATANALAGLKAGTEVIDTTVIGLGERAGNTPLEEIVMALNVAWDLDCGVDTHQLKDLADYVSYAADRPIPAGKSIVGSKVFAHESGIHVDGILKAPKNYEAFDPELVGAARSIVIGKHSGSNAVLSRLKDLGCAIPVGLGENIVKNIKSMAAHRKGGLDDLELKRGWKQSLKNYLAV